jgi:hypothetical protein
MDYTFMSTAYDHLDNAQNTMVNWTRNMFEEDDDLRVACDGLLTKCRAISTTLDELLNGDDDNDDDDDDSEGDDSDGVRDYWHMSCLVPNFVFQDSSDNILSKIQREAKSRVNMILNSPREEKITVAEFLNCITMQKPGSRSKQEDLALVRLHRGYSDSDTNEWVRCAYIHVTQLYFISLVFSVLLYNRTRWITSRIKVLWILFAAFVQKI